jgi:hypothetical protein
MQASPSYFHPDISSSSDDDDVDREVLARLETDPAKARFARLRAIFLGRGKRASGSEGSFFSLL